MLIEMLYKHFNFSITGYHVARLMLRSATCGPIKEATPTPDNGRDDHHEYTVWSDHISVEIMRGQLWVRCNEIWSDLNETRVLIKAVGFLLLSNAVLVC